MKRAGARDRDQETTTDREAEGKEGAEGDLGGRAQKGTGREVARCHP